MSDTNGQLTLFAFLTTKPDIGEELGRRLMALAAPARAEAGKINYDLHRSRDSPVDWVLYENWTSPATLEAHFEEGYRKAFVATLSEVMQGEMDLRRATMMTKVASPGGLTLPIQPHCRRRPGPASLPEVRQHCSSETDKCSPPLRTLIHRLHPAGLAAAACSRPRWRPGWHSRRPPEPRRRSRLARPPPRARPDQA
jgi:quinol monooxygenase YgiN